MHVLVLSSVLFSCYSVIRDAVYLIFTAGKFTDLNCSHTAHLDCATYRTCCIDIGCWKFFLEIWMK